MASGRDHTLDGLRAAAVTLVVLHHTVTQPVADGLTRHGLAPVARLVSSTTASGVELFFVLSGLLLLGRYAREPASTESRPAFDGRRYVRRRVERIWPPYLVALVFASAVVAFATSRPTWYTRSVLPRFSVFGVVRQLGIVNFGWASYNGAWWSLTVELLFYAILPAAIVVLVRSSRRWSPSATAIVALVVTAGAFVVFPLRQVRPNPTVIGQLTVLVMYLPCFVLGGLVASGRRSGRAALAMTGSGVMILGVSTIATSVSPIPAFALLYTALIVGMRHPVLHRVATASRAPLAVWVGERSYSMFLVHFSVLYLLAHVMSFVFSSRTAAYFILTRSLAVPAIVIATIAVFELAERPFARGLVTVEARWPWQMRRAASRPLALDPN